MTIPMEYNNASRDFQRFLNDALDASGLTTTNQVYTMVQGVLQCFRRRLEIKDAILFASVLPPVLRSIFVDDWDVGEPKRIFEDRQTMTREVQSLRRHHNFAPETSIRDVAVAVRKNIEQASLDGILSLLPEGTADFWQT